jgi:predicted nucleic acid-binding protein
VALVLVDASIVIAHLTRDDRYHEVASAALVSHRDDDVRISASAYAEALARPIRLGAADKAQTAIRALHIAIAEIGAPVAEEAARLRARHRSLRLPDALVIAHAEVLGADELLTTDARWLDYSPRVCVVR